MIWSLLRKELRQLLPLIVALGAVHLWSAVDGFILSQPDSFSWAGTSWVSSPDEAKLVAYSELIVGILIAYNLLPGEHDQRTIQFLYTLPIRRRTLFLVKYLTGCAILLTSDLAGTVEMAVRHQLNPGSFERGFLHPKVTALHLAADVALPFVFLAYGMLLSFFRRLGWVLLLLTWLAIEVAERAHPPLRVLNVKALFEVEHHGTEPLLNWTAWRVHGVMGILSLLLAARLWLRREERFAAFRARLRNVGRLARATMGLAVVAIATTLGVVIVAKQAALAPDEPVASETRNVAFETERFHFTYPASRANQALIVIGAGDEAYARVQRWLGAPDVGRVVADLTEDSGEHHGIAGWKKLRMDIRPPKSPSLLVHVLYHETTHVLAEALAQGAPERRQAELRFFDEGLAEYVSYALLANRRPEREHARRIAALARSRFNLRFEELVDPTKFLKRHDEYLVYALGEVWVSALVDTCGQDRPARLLRRFGRSDTPQTLAGVDLWRQTLQLERCDLERVVGAFEQHLRRLERDAAATLPTASGRFLAQEEDELVFQVAVEAPTKGPFQVTVRVRGDADAPATDVQSATIALSIGTPGRIAVPAPGRLGQRVEFQVGARLDPDSRPFFTRWQSTTLQP